MILIWVILALTSAIPLIFIFARHRKTLTKHWRLIVLVDFWVIVLWCLGESIARQNDLWHISFDSLTETAVLGTQLGNIIFFTIVTTILSTLTIIMKQAHQQNVRFRDLFFNKN